MSHYPDAFNISGISFLSPLKYVSVTAAVHFLFPITCSFCFSSFLPSGLRVSTSQLVPWSHQSSRCRITAATVQGGQLPGQEQWDQQEWLLSLSQVRLSQIFCNFIRELTIISYNRAYILPITSQSTFDSHLKQISHCWLHAESNNEQDNVPQRSHFKYENSYDSLKKLFQFRCILKFFINQWGVWRLVWYEVCFCYGSKCRLEYLLCTIRCSIYIACIGLLDDIPNIYFSVVSVRYIVGITGKYEKFFVIIHNLTK